jgi:hypothetical protein
MRALSTALLVTTLCWQFFGTVHGQSVAVVISEQTINDFLTAVGPVNGEGKGKQDIKYTWTVTEPKIDLEPGTAGFEARVKVNTKFITLEDRIIGRLAVDYDAAASKIKMQVVEATFPIYIKILGQKVKVATLDIGKYYNPKFEFNGPEPVQQQVEMDLGGGDIRLIGVTAGGREIKMEKDQLRVSVDLAYNPL